MAVSKPLNTLKTSEIYDFCTSLLEVTFETKKRELKTLKDLKLVRFHSLVFKSFALPKVAPLIDIAARFARRSATETTETSRTTTT